MGCNKKLPYCQKILPTVFDDSLSYYEILCKLTKAIEELGSVTSGDINDSIKKYIDENFNNLMLTAVYDEKTETIILKKVGDES